MDTHIHAVRRLAADVVERKTTELTFGLFRLYLAAAGATQSGSWVYVPERATPLKGWRATAAFVVALPDASPFLRDLAAVAAVVAEVHGVPAAPPKLPRPPSATVDEISKVAGAVAELAREIAGLSLPGPDALVAHAEADLDELLGVDRALARRVVRRAQYEALKALLDALDGWVEGAAENHEALGHRDADCCSTFAPDDVREMANDAARVLGVAEPWRPTA